MEFLRSVLAQDEAVVVSTRVTYDLPVNPLSHILFTMKAANDTGVITNAVLLGNILRQVSNISVEFKGSSVMSGSLIDLAALYQWLLRVPVGQTNMVKTDGDVRAATVILPFGRKLFNPDECFPAVKRGDLRLVIDYAAAQTGIDTLLAQIETVELMGAAPKAYLKATTIAKTLTSGIGNDIDLPIGNPIVSILMFGTTTPTGAVYTSTIDKAKILVDNMESHYNEANWETLHGEFRGRFPVNVQNTQHLHRFADAAAGETDTGIQSDDAGYIEKYAALDFDPAGDGNFLLMTEGKSRVHARITAGASDAARFLPVELIAIGGGA